MKQAALSIAPHLFGRAVCALSSATIIAALLLTHFIPTRFRIHPYPYLSDAGLRDPERIVLSFGLALSSVLFLPVAVGLHLHQSAYLGALHSAGIRPPSLVLLLGGKSRSSKRSRFGVPPLVLRCDAVPPRTLQAGVSLAFFLSLFTAVPGWFHPHHVFALMFAVSASLWSACHAVFSHAKLQIERREATFRLPPRLLLMYLLIAVQGGVVLSFGLIWGSVKAQIPYKMIPNKDPRFVILAFMEYVGTAAFVAFIGLVSDDLRDERIECSLRSRASSVAVGSGLKEVAGEA